MQGEGSSLTNGIALVVLEVLGAEVAGTHTQRSAQRLPSRRLCSSRLSSNRSPLCQCSSLGLLLLLANSLGTAAR